MAPDLGTRQVRPLAVRALAELHRVSPAAVEGVLDRLGRESPPRPPPASPPSVELQVYHLRRGVVEFRLFDASGVVLPPTAPACPRVFVDLAMLRREEAADRLPGGRR